MKGKDKRKHRIGCYLNDEEMNLFDRFLAKVRKMPRGLNVSKSDVVRESILSYIKGGIKEYSLEEDRKRLLSQAKNLRDISTTLASPKAKIALLLSIIKEIEAFSKLENPTELQMKSMVIEVTLALKKVTGYKRLPDIKSEDIAGCVEIN